jgi:hypothetical protein
VPTPSIVLRASRPRITPRIWRLANDLWSEGPQFKGVSPARPSLGSASWLGRTFSFESKNRSLAEGMARYAFLPIIERFRWSPEVEEGPFS